jgi:hypothetical protein
MARGFKVRQGGLALRCVSDGQDDEETTKSWGNGGGRGRVRIGKEARLLTTLPFSSMQMGKRKVAEDEFGREVRRKGDDSQREEDEQDHRGGTVSVVSQSGDVAAVADHCESSFLARTLLGVT